MDQRKINVDYMTIPPNLLLDNGHLNPEVITYNRKTLGLFRLYMLLYKLDVHALSDLQGEKGFAPKLSTQASFLWKIEIDRRVSLKKIRHYGQ